MADPIEIEIRADADEAIRDLRKLERELDDVAQSTEKGGAGWGNWSQRLTAATVTIQAGVQALRELGKSLVELAKEFDRQASIMNRFTGNIEEARRRIGGLISDIDLMVAQQKLAVAGIELTATEFANLAVAANETASALGTDAVQALDQLTNQLISGGEELVRFGVNLDGAKTKSERAIAAIEQLSERFGDVSSSADTFGGSFGQLEVAFDNFETGVFASINASDSMRQSLELLADTLDRITGSSNDAGLSFSETFGAVIAGVVTTVANQARYLALALEALADGDFSNAADFAFRALEENAMVVANVRSAVRDTLQAREAERNRQEEREARLGGRSLSSRVNIGGGRGGGRGARGGSVAEAAEEDAAVEDGGGATGGGGGITFFAPTKDHFRELEEWYAEFQRQAEEAYRAAERAQQEYYDSLIENARRAREEQIKVMEDVTDTAVKGGDMLVDAFAEQEGQKELWRGIADAAQAITSFAAEKYAAGALYLISSALHFKNAAEMGVGGGAPPASPAAARPVQEPSGGGGGGGMSFTINYNAPVAEAEIGRQQRRAERAASRRFGTTV